MNDLNTYLLFDGNCRQAMTFYSNCFGAELHVMTFAQAPGGPPKGAEDRLIHANLTKNGAVLLMASDIMPGTPLQAGSNFSIAIKCESAAETDALFAAFSENATITLPVQETFWAARYGMLTDQFGINWMFNFEKPRS